MIPPRLTVRAHCVAEAQSSPTRCNCSQRSRHSRPLRPGMCVETRAQVALLMSRPLADKSEMTAHKRASPPLGPSHSMGVWPPSSCGSRQIGACCLSTAAVCSSKSLRVRGCERCELGMGRGEGACVCVQRRQRAARGQAQGSAERSYSPVADRILIRRWWRSDKIQSPAALNRWGTVPVAVAPIFVVDAHLLPGANVLACNYH